MDRESVERIRTASFSQARRGYDRREVDRFLSRLADWLESGGGDDSRSQAIRDELARIGEQTAKILTDAHEVGGEMRSEAESYATTTRSEADAYAERTRIEADTYSKEQRDEADSYLDRLRAEAEHETAELRRRSEQQRQQVEAEAAARRRELEEELRDVEERRDMVLGDLQRLSSSLAGSATQLRSTRREPDNWFDDPDEPGTGDEDITEMVHVGEPPAEYEDDLDPEAATDGEAEDFEAYEDELEDEAAVEAGGETVEWDVEAAPEEQEPEGSEADSR